MTRNRTALLVALAAGLAGLLAVGAWSVAHAQGQARGRPGGGYGSGTMGDRSGTGMMGGRAGTGMMGDGDGLAGDGRRVDSLEAASQRAQTFADTLGLRAGEVMQFSNGFYAELATPDGRNATEVLIDQAGGGVRVEYGPAMMWNTAYGMHAGAAPGPARVSAADATAIARRWLDDQRAGLSPGEAEEFPGYFTLHTLRGEQIVGMMSVNAYTGAVWYHTWHGAFVAMSEE